MKRLIVLSLAFCAAYCTAQERSMTIFTDTYSLGAYKDILGEQQINENGNAFNQYIADLFAPVGSGKTSSAEVVNGYCSLLASGEFFSGTWLTLAAGRYDTLPNFNDQTKSLLTYKMVGINQTICDPKRDIPMLYDESGNAFPLRSQGEAVTIDLSKGEFRQRTSLTTQNDKIRAGGMRYVYNNPSYANGTYLNIDYAAGGFSQRAVTLNVPACYQVVLDGWKDDGRNVTYIAPRIFAAGQHNLADYGLNKTVMNADAYRLPNCSQPPAANNFLLQHNGGGKCVHPLGGSSTPAMNTPAILYPLCDTTDARLAFSILPNGSLSQNTSNSCLHPENGSPLPANGTRLVFFPLCSDGAAADADGNRRLAFEFTANGSIRHKNSGLCIHPLGDDLILANGCDTPDLKFNKLAKTAAAPAASPACLSSGKIGKIYASINLSSTNGQQIPSIASSAAAYCSPCGLTGTTSNNTLTFSCISK